MTKPISVAIVDDSSDLRENIGGYLDVSPGFRCLKAYPSAEEALVGLPETNADVVLMDINLGKRGMDGIECVRRLKAVQPQVQIIMLTVFEDADKIFRALAAG